MLDSILNGAGTAMMTLPQYFLCTGTSLALGALLAALHTYKNTYSKNFILTLILLPAIVQSVITVVNGNLGTGVAVKGAFSLVRFRSLPGTSREICSVFLAMASGIAAGMGYLGMAALTVLLTGAVTLTFTLLSEAGKRPERRELKVTIPENLDYSGIFDDIFKQYTSQASLQRVRTVNMGSLYELCYRIDLKNETEEKAMLDQIRCRNGNLTVVCGKIPDNREEL